MSYMLKTSDSDFTPHWHAYVSNPHRFDVLAYGIMKQGGINAGINNAGVALMMSYFDYRVSAGALVAQPDDMFVRWPDDRGLVNAALLAQCRSTTEAIAFLYDAVGRRPGIVGGNHLVADVSGAMAMFEHCNGRMAHRLYSEGGILSRGNDGLLIWPEEQETLPDAVRDDRRLRRETMERSLTDVRAAIAAGEFDEAHLDGKLKSALSSHAQEGSVNLGSICAHGIEAPAARMPMHGEIWTMTGVIFDVVNGRMHYSLGNPCHGRWKSLTFSNYPIAV